MRHVAPSLPAATFVAWFGNWIWFVGLGLASTLMLLLFPDGRPPSPRWRVVGWLAVLLIGITVLAFAVRPGPLDDELTIPNPFGISGPIGDLARAVTDVFVWPLGILALASFTALVSRFVRARGDERQQLKWVAYAATITAVGIAAAIVVGLAEKGDDPAFWRQAWFGSAQTPGMAQMPMLPGMSMPGGGMSGESMDMTEMVEHHKMALEAGKIALTRSTRREIQALAQEMIAAQTREIGQMSEWRAAWS